MIARPRANKGYVSIPAATGDRLIEAHLPAPLDPESRELLCLVSQKPAADSATRIATRITELARHLLSWDRLLAVAREHRILPLLHARLAEVGAPVPPVAQQQLLGAYHRNVLHCMTNAAELTSILKAFEIERIPALPFKGIVLGTSVYNDPASRNAGDIDILIRLDDLLRATAVLLSRGFDLLTPVREDGSPAFPDSHEYHFERPSDGMVVELRWRLELTQPRYRRNVGMAWLWPHRQSIRIAGVDVPNMDPETSLLVLCMHGSKHVWSRLAWICDVAQLLASFPALDWSRVDRDARRLGLRRALTLGVLLAHRIASAPVPSAILARFEADPTANQLAHSLEACLFDKPGELPPSRVPYNVRLLGFSDRLRLFLSPRFFRPNERDLAFLRLPRPLYPLYLFARPLRILRDKSAR